MSYNAATIGSIRYSYYGDDGVMTRHVFDGKNWVEIKEEKKPTMLKQLKTEATNAGYRVAAKQGLNLSHTAVIAVLDKTGQSDGKIKSMLNTEFGKAFLSLGLGFGISQIPTTNPHVVKIGEELRIGAMSDAGNEIISAIIAAVLSAEVSDEEIQMGEHCSVSPQTLRFPLTEDQSQILVKKTG